MTGEVVHDRSRKQPRAGKAPAEAADGEPLLLGRGNFASAATNLTANVAGSAATISTPRPARASR